MATRGGRLGPAVLIRELSTGRLLLVGGALTSWLLGGVLWQLVLDGARLLGLVGAGVGLLLVLAILQVSLHVSKSQFLLLWALVVPLLLASIPQLLPSVFTAVLLLSVWFVLGLWMYHRWWPVGMQFAPRGLHTAHFASYFLVDTATARDNNASAWVTIDPSRQQPWKSAREWWDKFDDVAGYRNTRREVQAGLRLIDEYFLRWMRLEYVPAREEQTAWTVTWLLEEYTSAAESADLARILDTLCGIWGIRSCYDSVGSSADLPTNDPDGHWQRIAWLYQLGVPTTRDSRERLYRLREERQRTPLNLSDLEDQLSHATIRFYQNLARLKPEASLLPEKEYRAAVIQRSSDEEDALIAHANRLRRCGLALSVKPPSYW